MNAIEKRNRIAYLRNALHELQVIQGENNTDDIGNAIEDTRKELKTITAAEFWENASPRLVRELYKNAGLVFTEAVLFSGVEFWQLEPALKVAIYEHPLFRKGDY